jgi:hypothetical protein
MMRSAQRSAADVTEPPVCHCWASAEPVDGSRRAGPGIPGRGECLAGIARRRVGYGVSVTVTVRV